MHRLTSFAFAAFILLSVSAFTDTCDFGGETSDFHGYTLHEFDVGGVACKVVCPIEVESGSPWVWRARFWGHEPQTDVALLNVGFHVAYAEVGGFFGNDAAVKRWNSFYAFLTKEHGFAPKVALEGMSRGGLIIYNWAIANPEKVACIYADAPVLDIRSWPGGKGAGPGSEGDWKTCLRRYDLTEETAGEFKGNVIDNLLPLVDAGIPLLHVVGAADEVVPVAENSAVLEKRYRALGGTIHVISKEGIGHHPHSLKDARPIVDFIRGNASGSGKSYFSMRGGLVNSGITFSTRDKARVAYLGGSITEMSGWREKTSAELQRRFPDTDIDFVETGIASTDSSYHAFRLESHVFGRGPVDLLFIESVVNELHNSREQQERVRGIEGLIRHARSLNPNVDIVVMYFVDPAHEDVWNSGNVPAEIADQELVTEHYNVPVINLSREIIDYINDKKMVWADFGDAHPKPPGHTIYANRIARLFDAAWGARQLQNAQIAPHENPAAPIDPFNFERGRFVDIRKAEVISGWNYIEDWTPADGVGRRKQFTNLPTLEAIEPGAELMFTFHGKAVGIMVTAGPDVGMLEYSIDGQAFKPIDQFTQWSAGLHIPWAYLLAAELDLGDHTLHLRTSEQKNDKSKGYACRIQQFLVN